MSTPFSQQLRDETAQVWNAAITHRFVRELYEGTIADDVMAGYLLQDYRFLHSFLGLLGAGVATTDDEAARIRLAQFIGEVAGDENTYFLRAFEALGVTEQQRREVPLTTAARGFLDLFDEAAATRSYAAVLAVLTVTEWLYLDWATTDPAPQRPENFVHAEWIDLHDYPGFHEIVAFLRGELDRVGPADAEVARDFFRRAVDLELAFFEESYISPLPLGAAPAGADEDGAAQ